VEDRRLAVACLGLADGSSAGELDGAWLVSYDPEGCDGYGEGAWSQDPADAARFTAEEWAVLWTASPANRPLRPVSFANESEPLPACLSHLRVSAI
jgi:hypothetical protein